MPATTTSKTASVPKTTSPHTASKSAAKAPAKTPAKSTAAKAPASAPSATEMPAAAGQISAHDIALRAYSIWQQRGGAHGCDVADWLEAERQLQIQ